MNEPIKHCVDCKHYIADDTPHFGRCRKRKYEYERDDKFRKWLVAGAGNEPPQLETDFDFCSTNRMETADCKTAGLLFEPKEGA